MPEYIERNEAISYIKDNQCKRCSDIGLCGNCAVLTAIKLFESIPAADVRPVVLCCDCKHFQVNVSPSGYLPQGVPEWECRHWCGYTDPTDFCSYGKKREES